jgi:hypothetical protein
MNRKLAVTLSLLMILGFGSVGQVLAQNGMPGVSRGDEFVYSITTHWSTSDPALMPPSVLLEYNSTTHYNVTVITVQSTNVTIMNNLAFTNGTVLSSPSLSNVASGQLYQSIPGYPAFQGFFDVNLAVNSPLYPSGNQSVTINQTVTRDYSSGKRDTNVVTGDFPISDINNKTGTQTITFYIDKSKGVLVERDDVLVFPDYTASIIWTLKSTNLWSVSAAPLPLPLPVIIIIAVVIIVVVVGLVVYRERKSSKKKNRN